MNKIAAFMFALVVSAPCLAANYEYIDVGDAYYINRFGNNNDYVIVERKLGDGRVKVRDIETGSTSIVNASKLLSESELNSEETANKAIGWGVGLGALWCMATDDCQ